MDKYKRLVSDTIVFGIGNFGVKIIYFILMPIYTMALSKEEFGLADLLSNGLALLMPALTLSIGEAVFRFALDKEQCVDTLLTNGFAVLLFSYFFVGAAVGTIYWLFDIPGYWLLLFGNYIFESLKLLFTQYTRALGRVWDFAINGIGAATVLLISTYWLVYCLHLGINGYILSFILAEISSIIYLIIRVPIICNICLKSFDKIILKSMLIYSIPLIPNMLSWWITNISSRYIVAGFCGIGAAGLFASASKLPALINVFSSIFQQSWQFASVKEYQNSDRSPFYGKVFQQYSFICLFVGSLMILAVPFISKIVLQGEFYQAWVYSPLLLFSALLGCYSIFFGTFYSVVKNNLKGMNTTLIGSIINVILCLCLIPVIGVIGALLANVCSYFTVVILRIRDIRNYVLIPIEYGKLIVGLGVCFVQAIAYMYSLCFGVVFSIISAISIFWMNKTELQALLVKMNIRK